MNHLLKVITFNLLSPPLCNPKEYIDYPEDHLNRSKRKAKILSLIEEWSSWYDQPIICLQEIPYIWKQDIERIVSAKDYKFFCMNYGSKYNGIFGVGIAVPGFYKVLRVEYLLVSEYIKTRDAEIVYEREASQYYRILKDISYFLRKVEETGEENFGGLMIEDVKKILKSIPQQNREKDLPRIHEQISEAKAKNNFTIRLKLADELNKKFIIYNYHLPCAFKRPVVQTLHINALKYLMSEHSEIPTIFAGDLNIRPNSIGYNYLTNGQLPDDHLNFLMSREYCDLNIKSSFNIFYENEPEFTCFSNTKYGGEFKDCLDYIMINDLLCVLGSELLLTSENKMPNDICPSDHLPLCSILSIK